MKKTIIFVTLTLFSIFSQAQIQINKSDGGTVITKLGMGVKVNSGSSLNREMIVLNDAKCPLQLINVGVSTSYTGSSYSFTPTGSITAKEPIMAYEIHHVLYDVFGNHIKTLSNTEVCDVVVGTKEFPRASWYASENQVSEYLVCVSYVSNIRMKDGKIWRYEPKVIENELKNIEIKYDEGYAPKEDKSK